MKLQARKGLRPWAALIVALAPLAALDGSAAAEPQAVQVGPPGEAFYEPPAEVPSGHGRLIWKRGAGELVRLEGAAYTKKVLYTSTSPNGEPIAVSGSVSAPEGEPPADGWPVISYGHSTTGVADRCAPSWIGRRTPFLEEVGYAEPVLERWLEEGYAVLRTDYEGLGTPGPHPYLVGRSEARGILDIVRAARELDPEVGHRLVVAGHSQGGQGALFAARDASSWTPELELAGAISYAPASHVAEQAESLPLLNEPSPISALGAMVAHGAAALEPRAEPSQILKPRPYSLYPALSEHCPPKLGTGKYFGQFAPSELLREGQPSGAFVRVVEAMNPAVSIPAPILLAQGGADEMSRPVLTNMLNEELVELGDDVEYLVYDEVDHFEIVEAAEADVLRWLGEQLPAG